MTNDMMRKFSLPFDQLRHSFHNLLSPLHKYVYRENDCEGSYFNSGFLFMWWKFFVPKTTIIEIDFIFDAREWVKLGFKILIGADSKVKCNTSQPVRSADAFHLPAIPPA
jgi:hypothetical protein